MAGLDKYDYTNENGYTTTLLLTAEDAKKRGLVSQKDAAKAEADAADKEAAEAEAKAKEEAEAKAKAEAEAKAKQAPAPQNKQGAASTK